MTPQSLRASLAVLGVSTALAALTFGTPGCNTAYLARQGYHQVEMLAGSRDVQTAIDDGWFSDEEVAQLRLVPRIKAFGLSIGLAASHNYETVNPAFKRTIWNLSACEPLAFQPRTWWFPIVGRVPYLGFFREQDALRQAASLRHGGWDVYVRTAGAYSTLGWFRDPLLPSMLQWTEYQLANTLLHELAHATLWVPGSVQFNESFANFVGDEASMRYLVATFGDPSDEVARTRDRLADTERFRRVLHDVYGDLDTLYQDPELPADRKHLEKQAVLASIPVRIGKANLTDPQRYVRWARQSEWNNARLLQFKTYNRSREWFEALYDREGRDLSRFIHRIREVAVGADDPYEALARAVGVDPSGARTE